MQRGVESGAAKSVKPSLVHQQVNPLKHLREHAALRVYGAKLTQLDPAAGTGDTDQFEQRVIPPGGGDGCAHEAHVHVVEGGVGERQPIEDVALNKREVVAAHDPAGDAIGQWGDEID